MGLAALLVATAMYVITAADLAWRSNYALSLTFFAYAVANIGLLVSGYKEPFMSFLRSIWP